MEDALLRPFLQGLRAWTEIWPWLLLSLTVALIGLGCFLLGKWTCNHSYRIYPDFAADVVKDRLRELRKHIRHLEDQLKASHTENEEIRAKVRAAGLVLRRGEEILSGYKEQKDDK